MGSLESCWGLPISGLMAHSETIDQLPRNDDLLAWHRSWTDHGQTGSNSNMPGKSIRHARRIDYSFLRYICPVQLFMALPFMISRASAPSITSTKSVGV